MFVEQTSKLIKKGYEVPEPPVHDFVLTYTDKEGLMGEPGEVFDITDDILEADSAMLVIMHKLEKADKKQAPKIYRLWQDAAYLGMDFYVLTGSGEREIDIWRQETGAEYPIATCDGVTLKTIVRANPGVVVLHKGTVVDKYNLRNR